MTAVVAAPAVIAGIVVQAVVLTATITAFSVLVVFLQSFSTMPSVSMLMMMIVRVVVGAASVSVVVFDDGLW